MERASKNPERTPGAPAGLSHQGDGSRARRLRRPGSTGACAALALGAATFIGMAAPAFAADPPAADQVWHGCKLDATLAGDLETLIDTQGGSTGSTAINDRGDAAIEVAFVVVYSLSNDNDGQPVGSSSFTGPIICTAPDFNITTATQTDPIPVQSGASVDILDEENAFILRYEINGGGDDGAVEKRFCHTVEGNTNCFRVR